VESALDQTYPNVEVIAVDDGSSDDSLNALHPYRDRITIIAKENRGQASCYSAGVSASSGDVVLFLDADDYLRPECIERALRHWSEDVSKLHFYLAVVDSDGKPIRATVPSGRLANEEALEMMRLFGSYCGPPASGNLFSAAFLRKILPLQNETKLTHSADSVPILSAPFLDGLSECPKPSGSIAVTRWPIPAPEFSSKRAAY
jgi:glycosyltransferase involved in cell wall biosynthesis